jgi:hypothetical protein
MGCWLALSVASAGVIGLNPWLHQLIEHGGHGPAHTHVGLAAHHSDEDLARAAFDHTPDTKARLLNQHERPFRIPLLAWLGESITHWLAGQGHDTSDPAPVRGHEHHSLPQLMASGFVDFHINPPLLQPDKTSQKAEPSIGHETVLVRELDAQTAGRGPPFCQS